MHVARRPAAGSKPSDPPAAAERRSARRLVGVGLALLLAVAPVAAAEAQQSFNMSLVANLPMTTATDCSAEGDLVFVGRFFDGVSVVDVSDLEAPVILDTWTHPGGVEVRVQDVRPLGDRLYATSESGDTFGLYELDISTPSAVTLSAAMGPPIFPELVHNLWVDGTHLYLSAYGAGGGNVIVDVSTPGTPEFVTNIEVGIHDNAVANDTLYVAGGFDGTYLYDVSDPQSPVQLAHFNPSTPDTAYYSHNAWPIGSSGYVFVTEEVTWPTGGSFEQGSLRVVDFSDPQNPVDVFRWWSENAKDDPNITIHNMYVIGDHAYLSHYQDGVRIFDVSDPAEPVEVGWYDTYPDPTVGLFDGCWGIFPFQGDDRIFASDRTYGLYVLAFNGVRKSTIQGTVRDAMTLDPIPGAGIKSLTANRSTFAGGPGPQAGAYVLKTGSGVHQLEVSAAGYVTSHQFLVLEDLGVLEHDVLLYPEGSIGVDEPAPGVAAIARLELEQASPNPLNPTTDLGFSVPARLAGRVLELAVFDVQGRRIRTLARGTAPAGSQSARWDGRDRAGREVASGLYLVRLRVGDETRLQKVVVAR